MEKSSSPVLMIIAGPNGSGKSTMFESNRKALENITLVNPDVIAKQIANKLGFDNVNELPEKLKPTVYIKAAKCALVYRDKLMEDKKSLVMETTASSNSILKLIDKAKDSGYRVSVHFVMLKDARLNIFRVTERVKKGVHYVEPEDIKRRYERAKSLMTDICIRADKFTLYDNSEKKPVKLITKHLGRVFVRKQKDNPITQFVCSQLKDKSIKTYDLKHDMNR